MENKFNWKLPQKNQLVVLLLIGVLLLVVAIPTEPKRENVIPEAGVSGGSSESSYEKEVEKRLEQILKEMDGVGNVKVMVTFRTSSEKVVEKDREEERESTVYDSAAGNGQTPYVKKEILPRIEGVVVIAQGGGNAVVVKNITETVQALFGVETHKIKVMKRNQIN